MNELALYQAIDFDKGDNFVIVIDTDKYSGNFEREISAFCLGAFDEDRWHGRAEADEFEEATEHDPRLEGIKKKVTSKRHNEYDEVTNTIWPTPNRLNDGYGNHFDAKEGEKGWPAYESVAVFVDKELTSEELELVRLRATLYAEEFTKDMTIRGVRQIKVTVARTESVVVAQV